MAFSLVGQRTDDVIKRARLREFHSRNFEPRSQGLGRPVVKGNRPIGANVNFEQLGPDDRQDLTLFDLVQ
jgi:hypothetical protein